MSQDIDIQSVTTGELPFPVAAEQAQPDTNTYLNELTEPSQVQPHLMQEPEVAPEAPTPVAHQPTEQDRNFKAIREELGQMKVEREQERREFQIQLDMYRANLGQQPRQAPTLEPERRPFDGMKDDDIPNVSELRREFSTREEAYRSRIEELEVQSTRPDYAEVIEKYALPLVKQKPHLADGIQGARNKALFAYELGKMAQQIQSSSLPPPVSQSPIYAEPQAVREERPSQAQRIVDNSRKPGTLSQAGGQSALSKADYFASMSDAEFMKMAKANLEAV